jgi:hypothetical protein
MMISHGILIRSALPKIITPTGWNLDKVKSLFAEENILPSPVVTALSDASATACLFITIISAVIVVPYITANTDCQ